MIRSKILISVAATAIFSGCQTNSNTTSNTAVNANSTAVGVDANSAPAANNATADDPGNFNGPPTEVYKAAYTARKNCYVAGLKKVMAKDLLDFLAKAAKDEKKSVDDELKDLCHRPQASTEQIRNEKINGDRASIEYLDENNEWQPMDFVREDGVWKMSLGAPTGDVPDNGINDKDDNRS